MPAFQIVTTTDDTYTEGDREEFGFLGITATLEGWEGSGDWVVLSYSDGITQAFPEAHIRSITELREEPTS
jgi:hypothetical protein